MMRLWILLGRPAAGALSTALALSVIAAASGIALLGLSGWFLTAAALAGAGGAVAAFNHLLPSTGIRALAIGRVVSRYAEQLVGHEATLHISAALRPTLFERAARSRTGLAPLSGGELAALVDDVGAVEGGFLRVVAPAFGVAAALVVSLGWTWAVSPFAATVVLAMFLAVCLVLPLTLMRRSRRLAGVLSDDQADLRSEVAAIVENAVELEIAGGLGSTMRVATDHMRGMNAALDRLQRPFLTASAAITLAGGLATLGIVAWSMSAHRDGATAAGAALATLAAFEAAAASARILDAAARARASASRLVTRIDDLGAGQTIAEKRMVISALPLTVQSLSVSVEGRPDAIGPLSLTCSAGEIVELTGPSGVGKSTMLEAIAALRPVLSGRLAYAGDLAGDVRPASVLARVAIAPQFPAFLPGALFEQLAYGRPDAGPDVIRRALETACMDRTVAGREASEAAAFSGGERRRLGLARALVAGPQLLLLDEPFAGIDEETSRRLRENLSNWVSGGDRAIIFTSHELDRAWQAPGWRRVVWPG